MSASGSSRTTVPVPPTVTALYAVMTPEPLERSDHLPLPHDALLRSRGSSSAGLAQLAGRPHQVVLRRVGPTREAARLLHDARVEALELAARHDGVVIDLLVPRLVEHDVAATSIAHTALWVTVDFTRHAEGLLGTEGLRVFGLPELTVASDAQPAMLSAVLTGVAHRIVAEWPAQDPVGPAVVTLRDIAYALGDPQAPVTSVERRLACIIDVDPVTGTLPLTLVDDPATTLFQP